MSSRTNENELLVAAALSKITNQHVITYNDYITRRYGDAITYNKLGLEDFQQICLDHSTNFADHIRPDTHNGATCSHCHALPPLTTLPLLPNFPYLVSAALIGVVAGSTTRGESSPNNHEESEPTNGEETGPTNNEMIIFVKLLNNITKSFKVFPRDTILSLKQKLEAEDATLMGLMGDYDLVFSGRYLLNDHGTLADYNIDNESTLHLIMKIKGGSNSMSYMDKDLLDPAYDFDFTKVDDSGTKYFRGPYEYKRPCGWNRVAFKAENKYDNNIWLGSDRSAWSVSYHGTEKVNANPIAKYGYLLSKGKRFLYGKGIYSSPEISAVEGYATIFNHNGEKYKCIIQNRVNPTNLKIIPGSVTLDGDYWITSEENIRPYAICTKKCNNNSLWFQFYWPFA